MESIAPAPKVIALEKEIEPSAPVLGTTAREVDVLGQKDIVVPTIKYMIQF